MSEPWFDANLWGWLPGTAIGVAGGLWGSLLGTLAPRGKGKAVVWTIYIVLMLAGVALFSAGIVGYSVGQPWTVWYPLFLPGILTLLVVGPLGYIAGIAYRNAEERKMRAQEFE